MKILLIIGGMLIALMGNAQNKTIMEVAVWDTYVKRKDGRVMHFDIIAPTDIKNPVIIYGYGKAYLEEKGEDGQPLTASECRFCHIESVKPEWQKIILKKGYYIYEMNNCD